MTWEFLTQCAGLTAFKSYRLRVRWNGWAANGGRTAQSHAGICGPALMGTGSLMMCRNSKAGGRLAESLLRADNVGGSGFLLLLFVFTAAVLPADTIVLKNGRTIVAESVIEQDGKVFYDGEGGRVSFSKSLVE